MSKVRDPWDPANNPDAGTSERPVFREIISERCPRCRDCPDCRGRGRVPKAGHTWAEYEADTEARSVEAIDRQTARLVERDPDHEAEITAKRDRLVASVRRR